MLSFIKKILNRLLNGARFRDTRPTTLPASLRGANLQGANCSEVNWGCGVFFPQKNRLAKVQSQRHIVDVTGANFRGARLSPEWDKFFARQGAITNSEMRVSLPKESAIPGVRLARELEEFLARRYPVLNGDPPRPLRGPLPGEGPQLEVTRGYSSNYSSNQRTGH